MRQGSHRYSLEDSLAHLAARFYRAMWKDVTRTLARQGLQVSAEQWPILIHVWDRNGQSQKELAQRLFKDKTTIARCVAGLESLGLVLRESSPEDRREKRVFLTKKGKEIMDGATATIQMIDRRAEACIEEEELAICKDVLRRVHKNLAD